MVVHRCVWLRQRYTQICSSSCGGSNSAFPFYTSTLTNFDHRNISSPFYVRALFLVRESSLTNDNLKVIRDRDIPTKKNQPDADQENKKLLESCKQLPFFLHQRLDGCCGPIAVIHSVVNCPAITIPGSSPNYTTLPSLHPLTTLHSHYTPTTLHHNSFSYSIIYHRQLYFEIICG